MSVNYICSSCGQKYVFLSVSDASNICDKCGANLTLNQEEEEGISPNNGRHYKTAFTLAKILSGFSWLILIAGVIIGLTSRTSDIGIPIIIISIVFGLLLVFVAQLTLIFIDTENNTRKMTQEIVKTNTILADALKK